MSTIIYAAYQGFQLGMFTITISSGLDYSLSMDNTISLMKKNPELYVEGLQANYVNLLVISPLYYIFVYLFLLDHSKTNSLYVIDYLGLLIIHNIGYYGFHKAMHHIPQLKHIHRFHHLFTDTLPTTGNAVSILEFNIAYVLPFIAGIMLLRPNNETLKAAIMTISSLNTFIHTPHFKDIRFPDFIVSPMKHMNHHKTFADTYAAPLLNIDYFMEKIKGMEMAQVVMNTNDIDTECDKDD